MKQENDKITMAQHWQDMYDSYKKGGNNNWIFRDRAVTGLAQNSIIKWNIPSYLHDDLHQVVLLAVDKSFNTYDSTKSTILILARIFFIALIASISSSIIAISSISPLISSFVLHILLIKIYH